MIAMLSFGIWARLAGIALLTLVTSFVIKLYANRQIARRLIKAGVDMPPNHSFLFGHLAIADEVMKSLPPFTTFDVGFGKLGREKFPNGIFMLDLWPFDYRLFIISSPQIAVQVEKHNMVLKPDDINKSFDVLATGPTLITMDEKRWKPWRKLLNPSFSPSYVLELAPGIATEAHVFVSKLRERSHYGKVFELEKLTANLALDVIGRAGMDTSFGSQEKASPLVAALRSQVEWIAFTSPVEPWTHWNPARPFILWNNQRIMRKEIGAELDKRFAEMQSQTADEKRSKPKTRSIVSLALANYVAGVEKDDELPPFVNFKTQLTAQIVLFLLAGHETTSSTICLCYHSLFTHSDALARIRKEHEEVFGQERSTSHISSMITTQPELLNQLPYTLAVIRETLRLYPPASQIRIGDANINLTDDAGNVFPTAGAKVWVNHTAVHRNPKYWPEPDAFIPERWLTKEGDPLYPVKGAWRPFEFGPRNCIGQTLALMEIKIVLLMTIREFDILPMYDDAAPRVWGSQAHMVQSKGLGGKPSNGYPVIVKTRL